MKALRMYCKRIIIASRHPNGHISCVLMAVDAGTNNSRPSVCLQPMELQIPTHTTTT